ncbi:MAG: ComEC/Rec2 family competence protein, partial [Nitrospinota bacterium]
MFPLDYITLGFIGGLLAGGILPLAGVRGALGVAALCLGASGACRWAFHDSGIRKASSAFMLAGAGALGIVLVLSFHQWMLPSHHLMRHLPRGRANLVGHLTRPIERPKSSGRTRLYIDVERLTIRGVEIPVQGSVRISLSYPPAEPYAVGNRVLVRRVRLRRPIRYRNPGAFNYPEFLRLRSIHATALASPRALERIKPMERFAFQRWLFGFRDRMRAHLREAFPEKTAGLLEAITLGIRENLHGEARESFRLAGASHILAISGLHHLLFLLRVPRLLPAAPARCFSG